MLEYNMLKKIQYQNTKLELYLIKKTIKLLQKNKKDIMCHKVALTNLDKKLCYYSFSLSAWISSKK